MRILLDTHVFLWWRAWREMRAEAMDAIRTADDVFVSAASAWEVSSKAALGRLRLMASFADGVTQSGFVPCPSICIMRRWPESYRRIIATPSIARWWRRRAWSD